MSKVPRLPHILGFGRVRGVVPFFSVFGVMSLRRCVVKTQAFRDKVSIFAATGSRLWHGASAPVRTSASRFIAVLYAEAPTTEEYHSLESVFLCQKMQKP